MARYKRLQLPTDSVSVQVRNKALWNDGRSVHDADFFTFGYSGRSTGEIFELAKQAGVSTVVDIRFTPLSMHKPDFRINRLRRIVRAHRLHYLHVPQLGVPREIRIRAERVGSRRVIWEWYDAEIVEPFVGRNLHSFLNMAEHPVALMCVEIDPTACHRHRLFLALEDNGLRGFDL